MHTGYPPVQLYCTGISSGITFDIIYILLVITYMALASKAALSRRALLSACLWCTPHSH